MINIPISNSYLRNAIYGAFEGKCFYTGQPIKKKEMVIDHVLPKNKGGEDSIYNYVLTSKRLNAQKNAKLDESMIDRVLYIVKLIYAPKVIKLLSLRSAKVREKKSRRNWKKEEAEIRKSLGGLYYAIQLEKKPWITRAHIDMAHKSSIAMFGMGLPFYEDVFGNSFHNVSMRFNQGNYLWLS